MSVQAASALVVQTAKLHAPAAQRIAQQRGIPAPAREDMVKGWQPFEHAIDALM